MHFHRFNTKIHNTGDAPSDITIYSTEKNDMQLALRIF